MSMVGGADVGSWPCYETQMLSSNVHKCQIVHALAACLRMCQVHLCVAGWGAFVIRHQNLAFLLERVAVYDLSHNVTPCQLVT